MHNLLSFTKKLFFLYCFIFSVSFIQKPKAQTISANIFQTSNDIPSVNFNKLNNEVSISNKWIRINYSLLKGTYEAIDVINNSTIMQEACSKFIFLRAEGNNYVQYSSKGAYNTYRVETVSDALGIGNSVLISSKPANGPNLFLRITLYKDSSFIALAAGVENTLKTVLQLKEFWVLDEAKFFKGSDIKNNFSLLTGGGGGINTSVSHSSGNKPSINNVMATFGGKENNHSLVIGGLSYAEFEKYAGIDIVEDYLQGKAYAKDPIGKRLDPGMQYLISEDRFYLDFLTVSPFDALEAYANRVRICQGVVLPVCDFPIVDTWFAQVPHFGGGSRDTAEYRAQNDSYGAVEEMNCVVRSGFLKYSPVAVLLEPDLYGPINQQGWWDDKHWQRGPNNRVRKALNYVSSNGQFVTPFETAKKWAGAVKNMGGIPMIYVQTGFRSNDYAEKFPGHMIFNQAYKPHVNDKGEPQYRDQKTKAEPRYLGYDYTDPGFIKHMNDVWENLRIAGVQGCKFDYPDYPFTGWPEAGGLENPFSTTAMHYRNIFKLAKNGLGSQSFIHERTLSRGSDVTLGLVTSQRTEGDTDEMDKYMVSRNALRWYKNRVLVNYDMDGKNPYHALPNNKDGMRCMLTMSYLVTGTLMIVPSFGRMTSDQIYDLSRLYPFHSARQSPRPIDAFKREFPQIYDFKVTPQWHQVTFYNTETAKKMGPLFFEGEIKESRLIAAKLKSESVVGNKLLNYIWNKFSNEQKTRLEIYVTDQKPFVDVFNKLIQSETFIDDVLFKTVQLSSETVILKDKQNRTKEEDFLLNKMLLIDALEIKTFREPVETTIDVSFSEDNAFGGLGLEMNREYHVFDFWNNSYIGKFKGSGRLEQRLRPGEARMMSVHEVEANPQVISTDRHIMQGYVDLLGVTWQSSIKTLSGVSNVVGGEKYRAIIATNGRIVRSANIDESIEQSIRKSKFGAKNEVITKCSYRILPGNDGLIELTLERSNNGPVVWNIIFE